LRWLPSPAFASAGEAAASPSAPAAARLLVADDNADMREYIARLLGEHWHVDAVADGLQALAAANRARPDVVISDVMMPGLDGFELLRALRASERTRSVPVILLSARAGEEARVEGLEAGADDYLVKPFAARELVARVQTQLMRAKVRSVEEAHALRLARIFEHAPVGVALLRGPSFIVEFANEGYLSQVGRREIVGRPLRDALPELAEQPVSEQLESVFRTGTPHIGRSERLLLDRGAGPQEAFFDVVYQPLSDDGTVTAIAVVCFEVTALARARREAEAASRAKDEFLAMLGHELRNPLAPILTALQLMQLRGITGAEREREIIERQVKHVVGLVDDLLDVSRITRGKVQLRRTHVEVADIVAKAIEMTGPALEERRHTLVVDVPRGLGLEADAARLAQVVANLLTNAAKYTDPSGTIRVAARGEGATVVLRVIDNGSGIAPEMLPRVFDLFAQERQDLQRPQGGLGIGLAIVRSLVEAHGGSVSVESAGKGSGAAFTIRLPSAAPPDDAPRAASAPSASVGGGRRILVVDDNIDAAEMLAESLRSLGHDVRVAHDGPAALAALAGFVPEVALLDLGLPVMDGFELAERLRQQPGLAGTRLIAITGYAQPIDRERTRTQGFDGHLAKPVDIRELDHLIRAGEELEAERM
jgi:signal transduction histidine kinase